MTKNRRQTEKPGPDVLPHYQTLLNGTDWASLATPCGTGEALPTTLTGLLDPDPAVREAAAKDALGQVTHQNTIYEATVPVALYVAAILDHPAVTAGDLDHDTVVPSRHPTLVRLLDWLSDTAHDADDECVAIGERFHGQRFLHEHEEIRAFRDRRPAIFNAVHPLLGHESRNVRNAALLAAIPLAEHPLLTDHRGELAGHAHRLLATSTDRRHRDRVLDALRTWGHDTSDLESAADVAARERYARPMTGDWTGGHREDPPF
ncbi:hypothetical protein [Streptomyces litchfieldiae]|uniref:HEAT repeat domain-containing protein n=1 Tax=Streptomyces litchfieldiae TaxID=3075543 RepID=A0ABU2N318_9ACTN|nr:hypothetical protein [Streptomyces sp. DSM 44938]MDT0347438.1 hypothetical protein [Streptomyces sp. DSM 44938]